MSILSLQNISFSYGKSKILDNISYDFELGKMYCIVGKSGAGKTTLLSLLSGLAKPRSGDILYDGKSISKIDKYKFRSKYIGVVFQSFNLITKFTAVENVVLSMDIAGVRNRDLRTRGLSTSDLSTSDISASGISASDHSTSDHSTSGLSTSDHSVSGKAARAKELLASVGISDEDAARRILKLSGGEQQRVAIARALSYDPQIILADEPTGNLDNETQDDIMAIFRGLADQGKCVILVSHSSAVAEKCDECFELIKSKK